VRVTSSGQGNGRDDHLRILAQQLHAARREAAEQRQGPVNAAGTLESQRRLLQELERFVAALEEHHLPVPPGLRDELALHLRLQHRRQ
jgi:hypothetical protein